MQGKESTAQHAHTCMIGEQNSVRMRRTRYDIYSRVIVHSNLYYINVHLLRF
jgi:hypothetical protein